MLPPEKFRTYAPPKVRPGRTFTRAAVEGALDAAALPIKAASRAADYFTGNHSTFSDISGKDAAESLEWLYDRTEPAQIRREERFAEGEIPQAQSAGKFFGEYAGGAPLAALTGRAPAVGAVIHAGKADAKRKVELAKSGLGRQPITRAGKERASSLTKEQAFKLGQLRGKQVDLDSNEFDSPIDAAPAFVKYDQQRNAFTEGYTGATSMRRRERESDRGFRIARSDAEIMNDPGKDDVWRMLITPDRAKDAFDRGLVSRQAYEQQLKSFQRLKAQYDAARGGI
jgi:hypothetical protein